MIPIWLLIVIMVVIAAGLFTLFIWNKNQLEKRFEASFKAIAFDLARNSQESWISQSKTAVESFVSPLKESLARYDGVIREIEKKRLADFADLKSEIHQLAAAKQELQKETANLVGALRRPQIGGSWGELTLRRVVELAGMVAHCDFDEQVSVMTEDGRQRPDLVIHLPSNRDIVVDAKASLQTYLQALSASNEEERGAALQKHAAVMREHLRRLSVKAYWNQFERAPEFVVMFIPGESFFSAALEQDPTLLEEGLEKGVILASPATLIALLRAVAYGWRQEEMAKSAMEVGKLGRELHDRLLKWVDHLRGLGDSLQKSVNAYNNAMGSLGSRVLVTARRLTEFGVSDGKELSDIEPISSPKLREDLVEPVLSDGQDTSRSVLTN